MTATRIGIALGGGGAKGLCHVSMLGVLDELGVRPQMIAGTSIGAIIGAIYASGRPADEIRTGLDALTAVPRSLREAISAAKQLPSWLDFIGVGRSSLLKVDTIIKEKMKARPPTIYVEPEIHDVRVLEFHKAERIYEQAEPARERLKRTLASLLH